MVRLSGSTLFGCLVGLSRAHKGLCAGGETLERKAEHVFLARQDISTQQVEALTKEFSDIIEAGGGKVAKSEYWGLKTLNFKIKKNRKAHYSLFNIDAPPAAVAEMERRMSLPTAPSRAPRPSR